MIVLPTGRIHKNIGCSFDFRMIGCYPRGQSPDMNYGKAGERPAADANISNVPFPRFDPICGRNGQVQKV